MATEKKLDCVILGLLSHENLTGYEIKKRMDTTLKCFWGASYGSIYPTLNGLLKDGMTTKLDTTENGRAKAIYTITEKGREHLKSWLCTPVERDEFRSETLLKLFFGNEIGTDGTLDHIRSFAAKTKKELVSLNNAVSILEQVRDIDKTHQYYLLAAMFGVKIYNAYLEWCAEAEKMLGGMEE